MRQLRRARYKRAVVMISRTSSLFALASSVVLSYACSNSDPVPFGESGAGATGTGSTGTGTTGGSGGQGQAGAENQAGSGSGGDPSSCTGDACGPRTCEVGTATADPCSSIPRFQGEQVVDGDAEDFCGVPYKVMTVQSAGFVKDADGNPSTADGRTSSAEIRVAWSPTALHVHVHVDDPEIVVGMTEGNEYQGDNVQLFVAASTPPNNVELLGPDCADAASASAAQQVYLVPGDASGSVAPQVTYVCGAWRPSSAQYAARSVDGGYEVELRYPWPSPVSAGSNIGFDLLVGVNDKPGSDWRDYEYGLDLGAGECGALYCNTGNWCTPTLAN